MHITLSGSTYVLKSFSRKDFKEMLSQKQAVRALKSESGEPFSEDEIEERIAKVEEDFIMKLYGISAEQIESMDNRDYLRLLRCTYLYTVGSKEADIKNLFGGDDGAETASASPTAEIAAA